MSNTSLNWLLLVFAVASTPENRGTREDISLTDKRGSPSSDQQLQQVNSKLTSPIQGPSVNGQVSTSEYFAISFLLSVFVCVETIVKDHGILFLLFCRNKLSPTVYIAKLTKMGRLERIITDIAAA